MRGFFNVLAPLKVYSKTARDDFKLFFRSASDMFVCYMAPAVSPCWYFGIKAADFCGLNVFSIDYRAFFCVLDGLTMSGCSFRPFNLIDIILELCYGLRVVGDPSSFSSTCLICSYSSELVAYEAARVFSSIDRNGDGKWIALWGLPAGERMASAILRFETAI